MAQAKMECPSCHGTPRRSNRCPGCWTDKCDECTRDCTLCGNTGKVTPEIRDQYLSPAAEAQRRENVYRALRLERYL